MKLTIILSIAGLAVGLAVAFSITPRYSSTAQMAYRDYGSILHDDMVDRFQRNVGTIMSRTSLSQLIQARDLYQNERNSDPIEDVIERMRRDVSIQPVNTGDRTTRFRITFTYSDRVKAQATVHAFMIRFLEEEKKHRVDEILSEGATVLDTIARLEQRVQILERNKGIAPPPAAPVDSRPRPSVVLYVVDPPSLPGSPVYPNRFLIVCGGIGAGLVIRALIAMWRRLVSRPRTPRAALN